MGTRAVAVAGAPPVPKRDQFAVGQIIYIVLVHVGMVGAIWHTNWAAVGVCILLHALCGGLGICVCYHRLLTHRSFKCPRAIEYTMATLGALSMEGSLIEWVAHHRQHHQYSDQPGDPHSARDGFWWSHIGWMFWLPSKPALRELIDRYAPDLYRVPYYRFLSRMYVGISLLLGALLYLAGGWPFVVWGMFIRIVLTYHHTFLVNSASHAFGYRNFEIDDLSTNCWWVAMFSYGEGWHNNHHAFPTSARHGLRTWEVDPAYGFIRLLEAVGLASDVRTPPSEKLNFAKLKAA